MRQTILSLLCASIALIGLLPCLAQRPAATLEIEMPKEVTPGAPFRLNVIVKNLSKEDIHIWKVSPDSDGEAEAYIAVEVRNSGGETLRRVDGKTIVKNGKSYTLPKSWLTRKGAYVKPNQELHDFLILSKLYDLSKAGTYVVSATADIPASDSGPEFKWIVAKSNTVSFSVGPAESR